MLSIIDKKIFTEDGKYLKNINCPKKISLKDLSKDGSKLFCKGCQKNIIDTQFTNEDKLIKILKKDKNTCLKISRLNPMFRFV